MFVFAHRVYYFKKRISREVQLFVIDAQTRNGWNARRRVSVLEFATVEQLVY